MSETIVCCKIPNGVVLEVYKEVEDYEPLYGGGSRKIKTFRPFGNKVELMGPLFPFGMRPDIPIVNGYAINYVDSEFMELWRKQNHDSDLLASRAIFIQEKKADVHAESREHKRDGVKTGLEPLDPKNLPKGLNHPNVKFSQADEMPTPPTRSKKNNRVRRDEDDEF